MSADRIQARHHPNEPLIVIGRSRGRIITGTYDEMRDLIEQILVLLARHDPSPSRRITLSGDRNLSAPASG